MIFDDNGQTESREKKETPYTSIHIFSLYKVIPDRANKKKSILYFMMIGCAGYMFALYMCVVCQERKKKSKQQQAKF